MAAIGIKDLKTAASSMIRSVEGGERYVVTRRGQPAAVIMSIDEAED